MTINTVLSCPLPADVNPLSPNGFRLSIQKLPGLTYFSQQVEIPNISLEEYTQATPFVRVPIPGDLITYTPLDVNFLVDAQMNNYTAVYNWIKGLGFPESYEQSKQFLDSNAHDDVSTVSKFYSDGILQVLGNTGNTVKEVRFVDLFPTALSSLVFSSANSDVQYLVGSVTFAYSYYQIL